MHRSQWNKPGCSRHICTGKLHGAWYGPVSQSARAGSGTCAIPLAGWRPLAKPLVVDLSLPLGALQREFGSLQRQYTNGASLQAPVVQPQDPLPLCKHRLPRLTDGAIRFAYQSCSIYTDFQFYHLPIDTCQSSVGSKGLKITNPGPCPDGSRARRARYWDEECRDLHDVTDIKQEDLQWDSCELLNITTRYFGSVALFCDGPKSVGNSSEDVAEMLSRKEKSPLNPTLG